MSTTNSLDPMSAIPLLTVPGVELRGVAAPYGWGELDVTFEAPRREITVLLGARGAGKTSTLRAIAGLLRLDAGTVRVEGIDVTGRAPHLRSVGLVPAGLGLAAPRTIAENIRFGLNAARHRGADREVRLAGLLDAIELRDRAREPVGGLERSEQVRVAIARAITTEPSLLLLDDPLAGVPAASREAARGDLRDILRRLPVSALVATDDPDDAAALASHVVVLGRGTVLQAGDTRHVVQEPASTDVATLLGYETLIEGVPEDLQLAEPGVGTVPVPPGIPDGALVQLMAHPAAILAVPRGHGLGVGVLGTVIASRPLGPLWAVEVALGARSTLLVRWEWDPEPPADGAVVALTANGTRTYVDGECFEPQADGRVAPSNARHPSDATDSMHARADGDDDPRQLPLSGVG
ncbi:MAG: ATP-binding cassette domain-containing protein [Dehalococcoidia bacterium]|nr:ATP-binding cassette domain-containing protein [Dehalococcoidia bacterium]